MKSTAILLCGLLLSLGAGAARADDDAQSRAYFETGAKAYEKGDYMNAIRAFDQAYSLTKRPGLIFSIAQSYKRQYAVDPNPMYLRKSLEYYRRFLAEDKSGKRRGDATSSIMEVEAIIGRLPADQQPAVTAAIEPPAPTQISITTQVDEAMVSIDGAAPRTLEPVEVKPGKHKIVLQAQGYFSEERELYAGEKQMTAIDVPLRPMPAIVTIEGRAGAMVTVDGTPRGTLPLLNPLEIDAGQRNVAISQSGFITFSKDYSFQRGKTMSVKADLPRTRQRIAAFVMFGTGVVFAGGGVLTALGAAGSLARAEQINTQRTKLDPEKGVYGSITADEFEEYQQQQSNFSAGTVATTVSFNIAAASAALGFLLYYFDDPKLPTPKPKKDEKAPAPKDSSPGLRDMMFVPVTTPGFAGVNFAARF